MIVKQDCHELQTTHLKNLGLTFEMYMNGGIAPVITPLLWPPSRRSTEWFCMVSTA